MVDDFFKIIKLLSLHYVIFCHGSCFGTILVALISAVKGKKIKKQRNLRKNSMQSKICANCKQKLCVILFQQNGLLKFLFKWIVFLQKCINLLRYLLSVSNYFIRKLPLNCFTSYIYGYRAGIFGLSK